MNIILVGIGIGIVLSLVNRRGTSKSGGSWVTVMFVLGAVLILPTAGYTLLSVSQQRRSSEAEARLQKTRDAIAHYEQQTRLTSSRSTTADESDARLTDRPTGAPSASAETVAEATTKQDGEMLLVPLSEKGLTQLLGKDAVAAIEQLNASVPEELRQAYAMIPIAETGITPVPGIVRSPVGTRVLEHAMSPRSLEIVQSAVQGLLAETDLENPTEPPANNTPVAETPTEELPTWVDHPGPGRVAIQSEFTDDPNADILTLLEPQLVKALTQHVSDSLSHEFSADIHWDRLLDISLTDEAMKNCIEQTARRTEIVGTTIQQPMFQTHALVKFPEELDAQVIENARAALKRNRATTVGMAAGTAWLSIMLLGIAIRVGRRKSKLARIAALPILGLLIIPISAVSVSMMIGMATGETFDFSPDDTRVACVIDSQH